MRRALLAILVIAVLAIGGGAIANTAYQAGLAANVTVISAGVDGAAVTPVIVPGYGYGYPFGWGGPGFGHGFLGFLGTLFFIVLLLGLIRAIAFRGGHGRHGGWAGPGGPGGPGGWGGPGRWGGPGSEGSGTHPWESRAHQAFEDWHRTAHDGPKPDSARTD